MLKRALSYLLLLSCLLSIPPTAMAKTLPYPINTSTVASNNLRSPRSESTLLSTLLDHTSLIAIGQVTARQSHWNQAHTRIETDYTFQLHDVLSSTGWGAMAVGAVDHQTIQVNVEGGFLADEGIGLWAAHEATFVYGETALLLLRPMKQVVATSVTTTERPPAQYQLVQGELGKFSFNHGFLVNHASGVHVPVAAFAQHVGKTLMGNSDQSVDTHRMVMALSQSTVPAEDASSDRDFPFDPMGDPPRWATAGLELSVKVNINSTQVDEQTKFAGDFFMAIQHAMATWSEIQSTDFTILYDGETNAVETGFNGENEILFVHKGANKALGQAQIWYTGDNIILEVDMWLNDDYLFSVTGQPLVGEVDLESVVVHELGHWAPLSHAGNPDAIMYGVLGAMELKRSLHADDINALMQLYPCDLSPCVHEIYLSELATPTPHPPPTATPTPTLVPTLATPLPNPTQLPTGIDVVYLPYIVH